jgi:hypothetical protein
MLGKLGTKKGVIGCNHILVVVQITLENGSVLVTHIFSQQALHGAYEEWWLFP